MLRPQLRYAIRRFTAVTFLLLDFFFRRVIEKLSVVFAPEECNDTLLAIRRDSRRDFLTRNVI